MLVGVGWKARCGGRKEKKKRWKKAGLSDRAIEGDILSICIH
jgi:hypothetical protein